MRRALLLFTTVIVLSVVAYAQNTPGWELFGGYQYTHLNSGGLSMNMNGFDVSLQENSTSWLGGIIDVSGSYKSSASGGVQTNFDTFAAGPQFTCRRSTRLQPFARIMFGGAHSNVQPGLITSNTTSTAFALVGGGGVDYVWKEFVAFRAAGDYVRSYLFSDTQNNFRISVGVNFRIGRK